MSIRWLISRCAFGAALALICAHVPLVLGQSAPLTLERAVSRAVADNPALRGSEYLLQAARAHESRAGQSPPVAIGAELEDFAGTGALNGVDALQATLRLSGVIELGGKRLARMALAGRETDIALIEQRMQRLDLLAQVATRFAEVAARQEQLAVAEEATRLAEVTAERVAERIRIGAAPRYELGRAQVRLARVRIDEEHAQHQLASSRVRLTAHWGATTPDFERVSANLFELPETKSLEQLSDEIDASPSIQRMLSRERLAEAQQQLARLGRKFDIAWSGGVRYLRSFDDTAIVASLAVPFGAQRRAEPSIREAEAIRSKAPLDVQSARTEAYATLFELYQELSHARLEAQMLREKVQPQAQSVLQLTEEAFRQGRSSFLEFASAQQQLLEVRRDAVNAAAEYHALLIEIERLTGSAVAVAGMDQRE